MPTSSKPIVLVATDMEKNRLQSMLKNDAEIVVIGFGLVESAVGVADFIRRQNFDPSSPRPLTLVGIAGTFDPDRFAVGTAIEIHAAMIDGIGVGNHVDEPFQSAADLGWPSHERIVINPNVDPANLVLSVAAASAGPGEAAWRRQRFAPETSTRPSDGGPAVEEMETYSVARICQAFGVPLRVIRGISNVVGDRDKTNWRIDQACRAAADLVDRF